MVKKIKKYAKFIVCVALIMGLIAPSYAALSASDGSAFVTKAEFDSALADFNARLTTFEAGINSKIDSQVTSYLDRNGIWNGSEQTFLNYASVYDFYGNFGWHQAGVEWTDDSGTTHVERARTIKIDNFLDDYTFGKMTADPTFKTGDPSTITNSNVYYGIPKAGSFCKTVKIIDKCTKAGLMFLTWIARDSARLSASVDAGESSNSHKGTWLYYAMAHNSDGLTSFKDQSIYNQLYDDWTRPLSVVATYGTGSSSLSGWGASVAPAFIDTWSSFQLSESVKFHIGYDDTKTGIDSVTALKSEQLLWNYTLQSNAPLIFAYSSWWPYGQYRIGLNGDAVQYTSLFFVSKNDPVYATIVFTVSGRTPENAVRFVSQATAQHFAGTTFMLSSEVY